MQFLFFIFFAIAFCLSQFSPKYSIQSTIMVADTQSIPNGFKPGSSFALAPLDTLDPALTDELSAKIQIFLKKNEFKITSPREADYMIVFNVQTIRDETLVYEAAPLSDKIFIPKNVTSDSGEEIEQTPKQIEGYTRVANQPFFSTNLAVLVYKNEMNSKEKTKPTWGIECSTLDFRGNLRSTANALLARALEQFGQPTEFVMDPNLLPRVSFEIDDNSKSHKLITTSP